MDKGAETMGNHLRPPKYGAREFLQGRGREGMAAKSWFDE